MQHAAKVRGAPSAAQLRVWAKAVCGPGSEVTIRIVGRREGASLNSRFRAKTGATNVLSFAYGGARSARGDIALCHPIIFREARTQRKDLFAHYAHLVVHGVLHLRGFTHRLVAARKRMEAREVAILRRLGFADPYAVE